MNPPGCRKEQELPQCIRITHNVSFDTYKITRNNRLYFTVVLLHLQCNHKPWNNLVCSVSKISLYFTSLKWYDGFSTHFPTMFAKYKPLYYWHRLLGVLRNEYLLQWWLLWTYVVIELRMDMSWCLQGILFKKLVLKLMTLLRQWKDTLKSAFLS